MAGNRDLWDAESQPVRLRVQPRRPVRSHRARGSRHGRRGEPLATLVNYACHATTLAWQNSLISPDFPGAMREVVEEATGAPCVFLQGASGDTGPRDGFVGDTCCGRSQRAPARVMRRCRRWRPSRRPRRPSATQGPAISGTTLGLWEHVPFSDEAAGRCGVCWRRRRWTVPLAYRSDMPSLEQARARPASAGRPRRAVAREAGDDVKAADCRGKAEQARRVIDRLALLPPGPDYPLAVVLLQTGDAFWLAVEAEHYNVLQRELRERFPDVALVVMTLMDGGRVAYLPTAETYGKGLYQETIALLAPGSLERLIEEVSAELAAWGAGDRRSASVASVGSVA